MKYFAMAALALSLGACATDGGPYGSVNGGRLVTSAPQPPVGHHKCYDCIGHRQDANPYGQ